MRWLFCILMLLLLGTACQKEEANPPEPDYCWVWQNGNFEYLPIDQPPLYLDGGEDTFYQNIALNLTYPAQAREEGVEGIVKLTYEVTENGTVEQILIAEDIGAGCGLAGQSALEAAASGEAFSPAELDGIPVRVKKELQLTFKLE